MTQDQMDSSRKPGVKYKMGVEISTKLSALISLPFEKEEEEEEEEVWSWINNDYSDTVTKRNKIGMFMLLMLLIITIIK